MKRRKQKKQKERYTKRQNITGYGFMSPFLIMFVLFTILPVVLSIILSFTYFNGFSMPSFVGFGNYIKLFLKDTLFTKAVSNTLVFALITGPLSYLLCFFLAWAISEFPPKLRSFLTLLFYAPSICGSAFTIFTIIFSGDRYGWINSFLLKMNIIYEPIQWLTDTNYMFGVAILIVLWSSLGTSFLAFIAGFLNVDQTLYEAGAMDGVKNRWQELWYVTLPAMKPQLMFGAVMQITSSFAIADVSLNLAGNPSVNYAGATVVTHLLDYGTTRLEMGYASAIATILFLLMVGSNQLVQKLLRRVGE